MPDPVLSALTDVFGREAPFITNHKVAVCGGREYTNYTKVKAAFEFFLAPGDIVIHGGAKGADTLAERVAIMKGYQTTRLLPNWDRYGDSAGPRRNEEIARMMPRMLIAFPGGRGTADMVKRAHRRGIPVIEIQDGSDSRRRE